jgi:hypothetical protein
MGSHLPFLSKVSVLEQTRRPQNVLMVIQLEKGKGNSDDDKYPCVFDENSSCTHRRNRRSIHPSVSDKNVLRSCSFRPTWKRTDCFPAGGSDASRYRTIFLFAGRLRGYVREPDLQRLSNRPRGPVRLDFRTNPHKHPGRGSVRLGPSPDGSVCEAMWFLDGALLVSNALLGRYRSSSN